MENDTNIASDTDDSATGCADDPLRSSGQVPNLKNIWNVETFEEKIKNQRPENFPCELCKTCIK